MFLVILCIPTITSSPDRIMNAITLDSIDNDALFQVAQAGGQGSSTEATANMSRVLTGISSTISNSYSDLTHLGSLDLSGYVISGWTLYRADIDMTDMTAISERESLGVTPNPSTPIMIRNASGLVTDALTQAFYNQPHDGRLENYTVEYAVPYYTTSLGKAWLVVRSDYSDGSTNETSWVSPFTQNPSAVLYTHDVSSDNAILSSGSTYYVVIDGTALSGVYIVDTWYFNRINWEATDSFLGLQTLYNLRGDAWWPYSGINRREANLNYTYTPWNQTSNAALKYFSADEVSLLGNSTGLTGTSWEFLNGAGLSSIAFQTNQSIDMTYDLTLWYKRNFDASTIWDVQTSGDSIEWNITAAIQYPNTSGTISRYMNFTRPLDWSVTGLYNSTTPSTNYGNYAVSGTTVTCSSMTNGTWTLSHTADNYITEIQSPDIASIEDTVTITAIVEDGIGTDVDSGSMNLTATYEGSAVYNPPNRTYAMGFSYLWNIDAWVSSNGTYVLEMFWTNGTEAGYLTKEILVYYPTSLTGNTQMEAFTDSSFEIRVDFVDTFSPTPLTATYASVVYSYDSGSNVSLTDLGNGTWTAVIDTTGEIAGLHSVVVYAEGFAIENQSLSIDVELTYETLALTYNWTDPQENGITYLQSTNLTILYRFANGTAIANAIVNVTDGTSTWSLTWDPVAENYTIQFNGTDFSTFPDTINLTVNAWKLGHESQANSSLKLYVYEESATSLEIIITPSDQDMTYVESFRIIANYSYSGSPVPAATLTIQFNVSTPISLQYNSSDGLWYTLLPGSDIGVGYWEFTVFADAVGYGNKSVQNILDIWEDVPVLTDSWSDHEVTDYETNIVLNVSAHDSLGNPILNSNLTVTLLDSKFTMTHLGNGLYSVAIIPDAVMGTHQIQVILTETGFVTTSIQLNLTIRATTEIVVTSPIYSQYETEDIEIAVEFVDDIHRTIIYWATVNLTIEGTVYPMTFNGSHYVVVFVLDFTVNYHTATISALANGTNPATEDISIRVLAKTYVYISISFSGSAFQGNTISIDARLRENDTERALQLRTLLFNITVNYDNGTSVLVSVQDSTNAQGLASVSFDIPQVTDNRVTSILIEVFYDGSINEDYVYWDASKAYTIPVNLDPIEQVLSFWFVEEGRYVLLGIGILAILSVGYNKRIKPKKRAGRAALDRQLKNFEDLKSVQHFMAVYVNRGTCVFYHPFKEARIQADLISGFISAVTSVYGEIKGDGVQGTLEEIQYQGLRLNSYSGEYVLGILILDKEISVLMRDRLQFFVDLFENEYESHLDGWTGITDCFDPEWIVSNLISTLGYSWMLPHTLHPDKKLSGPEKKIVNYIQASLGNKREFLVEDYLQPLSSMLGKTEAEILDIIVGLEEKEIIQPISIHTFLQRQGLGIVSSDMDMQITPTPIEEIPHEDTTDVDAVEEPADVSGDDDEVSEPLDEPTSEEEEPVVPEEDDSESKPEEIVGEEPETEDADPRDEFLKEVESLLKKEKEEDGEE